MNVFAKLFQTQVGWAVIAGAAVGTAGTLAFLHSQTPAAAESELSALSSAELDTLAVLDSAGVKLVEQAMPSVVQIRTDRPGARSSVGAGVGSGVIYRSDGYIITNAHVVGGAKEVTVVFQDGREVKGESLHDVKDIFGDIAVVKVDRKGLDAAKFADSAAIKPGQWAVAIGAPFGLPESVTFGHISGLGRANSIFDWEARGARHYFNMIQTDAAINPGNSGGPLLNYKGEVVGINAAISSLTGTSSGVGFAIPSNTARLLADQLIEQKKIVRGYIGIRPGNLLGYEIKELGVSQGAIVRESNVPAAEAGIKVGDVIVDIGGKPVRGEQDLRDAMLVHPPGKTVDVRAVRSGETKLFKVKLTERPPEPEARTPIREREGSPFDFWFGPQPPTPERPRGEPPSESGPVKLGVVIRDLTDEERQQAPGGSGVVVTQVEDGSVAERSGVRPGMLILRLGETKIGSLDDLRNELSKYKTGDRTMLTYAQVSKAGVQVMSVTVRF